MSDLLQTIQDQIAKEWFLKHKPFVNEQRHQFDYLGAHVCLDLWPEVCKRYAFEVAKASLKEASENVKIKYLEHGVITTDKESITSESNIKL